LKIGLSNTYSRRRSGVWVCESALKKGNVECFLGKSITFDGGETATAVLADISVNVQNSGSGFIEKAEIRRCDAFDQLVTRYTPDVFSVAFRLTEDREDANDITQETFMSAVRWDRRISRRLRIEKPGSYGSRSIIREIVFGGSNVANGTGQYRSNRPLAMAARRRSI
jgi:hypothetical protein